MTHVQDLLDVNDLQSDQVSSSAAIAASAQLVQLLSLLKNEVKVKAQASVAFARAVRTLHSLFGATGQSGNASGALCKWLLYSGLDPTAVNQIRERHWTHGSLWKTDADCDWWEKQLADGSLRIKSMRHLHMLVQHREMIIAIVGEEGKHKFWLQALQQSDSSSDLDRWIRDTRE